MTSGWYETIILAHTIGFALITLIDFYIIFWLILILIVIGLRILNAYLISKIV